MLAGKDVLLEDIREYCVLQILDGGVQKLAGKAMKFFDYIDTIHELCPNGRISQKCSRLGSERAKVNTTQLDDCVKQTFEHKGTVKYELDDNAVLNLHARDWLASGTHLNPMIVINGQTFRGQMNPDNVFEDICASFTVMPSGCKNWLKKEGI